MYKEAQFSSSQEKGKPDEIFSSCNPVLYKWAQTARSLEGGSFSRFPLMKLDVILSPEFLPIPASLRNSLTSHSQKKLVDQGQTGKHKPGGLIQNLIL